MRGASRRRSRTDEPKGPTFGCRRTARWGRPSRQGRSARPSVRRPVRRRTAFCAASASRTVGTAKRGEGPAKGCRHGVAEDACDRWYGEEHGQQYQLGRDGPEQEPVAAQRPAAHSTMLAAAGEGVGQLAEHDRGERGARRGREQACLRHVAEPPAAQDERGHEGTELDRRLCRADHPERPAEQPQISLQLVGGSVHGGPVRQRSGRHRQEPADRVRPCPRRRGPGGRLDTAGGRRRERR